jgi:hypothetical protein
MQGVYWRGKIRFLGTARTFAKNNGTEWCFGKFLIWKDHDKGLAECKTGFSNFNKCYRVEKQILK